MRVALFGPHRCWTTDTTPTLCCLLPSMRKIGEINSGSTPWDWHIAQDISLGEINRQTNSTGLPCGHRCSLLRDPSRPWKCALQLGSCLSSGLTVRSKRGRWGTGAGGPTRPRWDVLLACGAEGTNQFVRREDPADFLVVGAVEGSLQCSSVPERAACVNAHVHQAERG